MKTKTKKILLLLSFVTAVATSSHAAVSQIRWGSSDSPLSGLTITWSSAGTADSLKWGYTTTYEKGKFLGTRRLGYAAGSYFFKYPFGNVTPSSTIYYSIYDSSTRAWGVQKLFNTAPPANTSTFTFTAFGDARSALAGVFENMAQKANARHPNLSLFNGDLTYSGNVATEYNTFFSSGVEYLENNLVYHAEGNHETPGTAIFTNLFELPLTNVPAGVATNLYYATTYGNAIFITINSCDATNPNQLTWLRATLAAAAANPAIKWKVVTFHHPFFNAGSHQGDMNNYRGTIWKAFDDYGVDLILNGHDHNYQRSKPINYTSSTTVAVAQYGSSAGQGRCEIVCGGAGAGTYSRKAAPTDAWAMDKFTQSYNFIYCEVNGCTLKITAYGPTDNIIDQFTLDKSATCVNTAVNDVSEKFNPISVYPNPSTGTFSLKLSSQDIGNAEVTVFDMYGKQVFSKSVQKNSIDFDQKFELGKVAAGIYNVSIQVKNQKDNAILVVTSK